MVGKASYSASVLRYRVAVTLAAALVATTSTAAPRSAGQRDLFAFSEGALIVQMPDDAVMSQMDSSPINLIDGNRTTDWTGAANKPAVFVIELAERTELSRIAFDQAFLNIDSKAASEVLVEISDTSPQDGFQEILSATLKMRKDNQSFSFDPENLPVGRWIRLTVLSNYGNDYSAMTGFRGYGKQLTQDATMPEVTGTYEGWSGWGKVSFTESDAGVSGCYAYQGGQFSGQVNGRVLTLEMTETAFDGSETRQIGHFTMSDDGRKVWGIARASDDPEALGYATYMSADRTSTKAAICR